jgi:hypothetical protein
MKSGDFEKVTAPPSIPFPLPHPPPPPANKS